LPDRTPVPEPIPVVRDLRNQALAVEGGELGLAPTAEHPRVWGLVMETGYPQALVTLVVLAEGTTSLYVGSGGGVIGAGAHELVRRAAAALLDRAEAMHDQLEPTHSAPLPAVGEVRFYARTFGGLRSAAADERTLAAGSHRLSPLFLDAHRVITAIREHS
jgi:hypothetical protein